MIKEACYLIVRCSERRRGPAYSFRVTKQKPSLRPNEIAIELAISLPKVLFSRPALTATIDIDEADVSSKELSAEMVQNIQKVVRQQLGIDMAVQLVGEPGKGVA